jgi:hypothetical protein
MQQKRLHLDIRVEDLDAAVAHAVAVGARPAAFQPQEDVRVLFDPAGHLLLSFRGRIVNFGLTTRGAST